MVDLRNRPQDWLVSQLKVECWSAGGVSLYIEDVGTLNEEKAAAVRELYHYRTSYHITKLRICKARVASAFTAYKSPAQGI